MSLSLSSSTRRRASSAGPGTYPECRRKYQLKLSAPLRRRTSRYVPALLKLFDGTYGDVTFTPRRCLGSGKRPTRFRSTPRQVASRRLRCDTLRIIGFHVSVFSCFFFCCFILFRCKIFLSLARLFYSPTASRNCCAIVNPCYKRREKCHTLDYYLTMSLWTALFT